MLWRNGQEIDGFGKCGHIGWNMLTLAPSSVGAGTWTRLVSNTYPYCGYFTNIAAAADGDNFSVEFWCPAGVYTVRVNVAKLLNSAIFDLDIDGVEIGSIDLNAGPDNLFILEVNNVTLAEGPHTMRYRVDGRTGIFWVITTTETIIIRTA